MKLRSSFLFFALATLGVLTAFVTALPPQAQAEEPRANLGPVGPFEPILATIGTQRVVAYYQPERGNCSVNAVVWRDADVEEAPYASTRVRIELKPGEMFSLDAAGQKSMNLLCGAEAATLAVVAPAEFIRTGSLTRN